MSNTSDTAVRLVQGGNLMEVDTGGAINVLAGGKINTAGKLAGVSLSAAAGTTSICLVTIQAQDYLGASLAGVFNLDIWLSDAATGVAPSVTTASGTVTAGTAGVVLGTYTAKQSLRVQTDATGKFILAITDTAKTGFYVAAQVDGKTLVSAQLITANYG